MKTIHQLKAKLAAIKAKVRDLKRDEKLVTRFQCNRQLSMRLKDGDTIAAKIMLARRAGKKSAEVQRELGWPNLERAWAARRRTNNKSS
jgi:hypothetical protein